MAKNVSVFYQCGGFSRKLRLPSFLSVCQVNISENLISFWLCLNKLFPRSVCYIVLCKNKMQSSQRFLLFTLNHLVPVMFENIIPIFFTLLCNTKNILSSSILCNHYDNPVWYKKELLGFQDFCLKILICRKNVVIVIFIGIVGSLLKLFQTLQKRVKKFEPIFSFKKNVLRAWTKIFKSYNCVKLLKIYILKQLCFVSFSCCSYVGRRGGVQYLSLGFGCLRFGIVTHELGNVFSTFFFSHV